MSTTLKKRTPIASVKILSINGNLRKLNNDIYFIMVLSGEIKVLHGTDITYLNCYDLMMISSEDYPVCKASGNNLVLFIAMKKDFFQMNMTSSNGYLVCNSSTDYKRDYSELRRIFSQMALAYFSHDDLGLLHQIELSYALIYYLMSHHYEEMNLSVSKNSNINREDFILSYLEQHYTEPITLTDLSDMTHLNISYLSRYFKQKTGDSLYNCLQQIRLRHAANDLLETDNSITGIAYENGFSSPAAFAKAFLKSYSVTPSDYRKINGNTDAHDYPAEQADCIDYHAIEETLNTIAQSSRDRNYNIIRYPAQVTYTINYNPKGSPIKPIWKELINLGYCEHILASTFQEHLATVQNEIGFKYARIEGLLNNEISSILEDGGYNFSKLDRFINILLKFKLKPFIDLTIRSEKVYIVGQSTAVSYKYTDIESSRNSIINKTEAMIRHLINNYGVEEVEGWIFDIGANTDRNLYFQESPKNFVIRFQAMYDAIKEFLPNAVVGGVTYNTAMCRNTLRRIFDEMSTAGFSPDFISLSAFPYIPPRKTDEVRRYAAPDSEHIVKCITDIKKLLSRYRNITQKIYVVAMGASIQTKDYINDSCFQSSFIAKNTIELIGLVDMIGYWKLSDFSDDCIDSTRILFGSAGILSKDGLKKPGFITLKRFGFLSNRLIKKEKGMLCTTNGLNVISIVLYNYSHFNELYCISGAQSIAMDSVYTAFSDEETKDININISGLTGKRYKVVASVLNREHGSLLDEWMRFGITDGLQMWDINYFRDIVHPQRFAQYEDCTDGTINIHVQMLAHEVRFYTLFLEL